MPRKSTAPGGKRTKSILVKVNPSERAIIQALAKARGEIGAGGMMRTLALRAAKRDGITPPDERRDPG